MYSGLPLIRALWAHDPIVFLEDNAILFPFVTY
jgi:hypothetical protein